jgi:hypothetical protein
LRDINKSINHITNVCITHYHPVRRPKSKNRILLVDDEPDITFTFTDVLEEEGFKVDSFNDPHTALTKDTLHGHFLQWLVGSYADSPNKHLWIKKSARIDLFSQRISCVKMNNPYLSRRSYE